MGLPAPIVLTYDDLCRKYNVEILTAEHEEKMVTALGKSVAITMFPERTSPFWNMKYAGDKLFNKIDIILMGQETIDSGHRQYVLQHHQLALILLKRETDLVLCQYFLLFYF